MATMNPYSEKQKSEMKNRGLCAVNECYRLQAGLLTLEQFEPNTVGQVVIALTAIRDHLDALEETLLSGGAE